MVHSTVTCIIKVLDVIYNYIENGLLSGVIVLGLNKGIWYCGRLYSHNQTTWNSINADSLLHEVDLLVESKLKIACIFA